MSDPVVLNTNSEWMWSLNSLHNYSSGYYTSRVSLCTAVFGHARASFQLNDKAVETV